MTGDDVEQRLREALVQGRADGEAGRIDPELFADPVAGVPYRNGLTVGRTAAVDAELTAWSASLGRPGPVASESL